MYRVGVDIGGTFTDTILIDDNEIVAVKTPTTDDFLSGVSEGVEAARKRVGIDAGALDVFSHGSTVALNALIEETGADTAILTTEGFRDVIEYGGGFRPESLLYDTCGEYERPLVPRRHRYEVDERITADGEVSRSLDVEDLDATIDELATDDIESVAVCLLHSYRNPEHEQQVARRIKQRAPDLTVSTSCEVSPRIREYSRMSTTTVDAYLKPTVGEYLSRLQETLEEQGLSVPITIMKSDGGLARPEIASKRPYTQMIAGPVAGVKGAQFVGEQVGINDLLTFDMGGTSCDAALIENGTPAEEVHRTTRGMKINGPFVNIITVGAGGGSIAWLDDVDALRVGPRSAGANPGPVCYGQGGTQPTVTDADLVLGILNPENFAGGEMTLDEKAARNSIETEAASPLEMDIEEASLAIREIIDNEMASALRVVSVQQGKDPRDFALVGFGGAGPMHACSVAEKMGIETVIFPNKPGLLSSLGLLVADIRHDYVRSVVQTLDDVDVDEIAATVTEMLERGIDELAAEAVPPPDREFRVLFDMMYASQAHFLRVPLPGGPVDPASFELTRDQLATVAENFEQRHKERYGFTDEQTPIEFVNVHVEAVGYLDEIELTPETSTGCAADAVRGNRSVLVDNDNEVMATTYDWERLPPTCELEGPAIVEMSNSTIWLPPSATADVDEYKNIVATLEGAR